MWGGLLVGSIRRSGRLQLLISYVRYMVFTALRRTSSVVDEEVHCREGFVSPLGGSACEVFEKQLSGISFHGSFSNNAQSPVTLSARHFDSQASLPYAERRS
jgi:hypothetical protein